MSTTFAPEEIIQANQFRLLSQKALYEQIQEHQKLGVFFPNQGLDAVVISYSRYKAMAERLAELEDEVENLQLIQEFGHRFDGNSEQWIEHPEGLSTLELYRQRQKDRTGE